MGQMVIQFSAIFYQICKTLLTRWRKTW